MKKITLINAYGEKNIGDAAILTMAVRFIHETYPQTKISILSQSTKILPSLTNFNSFVTSNLLPYAYAINTKKGKVSLFTKCIRFITIYFKSMVYIVFHTSPSPYPFLDEIISADTVISMGGGYLRTKDKYRDYFGLLLTILPIIIAKIYKKPLLFLPMSFGNFASKFQEKIALRALENTRVLLRDSVSLDAVNLLDRQHKISTSYAPDLGLFYKNNGKNSSKKPLGNQDYIVLTAREWLNSDKQDAFEKTLADIITYVWNTYHMKTVFIPMSWNKIEDDDNRVAQRLFSRIKNKNIFQIVHAQTPDEVQLILSHAYFAICTRMHSAILAYTVNTPFITIAYEHKSVGFMKLLDLTSWNTMIEEVTFPRLKHLINKLLIKKNYTNFKKALEIYRVKSEKELHLVKTELTYLSL